MRVGKFEIFNVKQDWFALDGGVLFSGIPREHWRKHSRPGKQNLIRLPVNNFLVCSPRGARILIDASLGDVSRFSARAQEQFRMRNGTPLPRALARFGLRTADIDMVLYTHLHFDHAGGAVRVEEGGIVPVFPRARSVVHQGELAHALELSEVFLRRRAPQGPHLMTQSSYRRETVDGVAYLAAKNSFETFDGEGVEIERGITMIRTPGHTAHHASVLIESEGQAAFIAGALVTTRWHAHHAYSIGNDVHAAAGVDKKLELLTRAFEERWRVLLEHDTLWAGRILRDEQGAFRFEEASHA